MKNILENGVSMYPKYDGRFPLVSGLKFKFDPSREVGDRVLVESMVTEVGDPIQMDAKYSLAVKYYISTGKDGYSAFLDPEIEKIDVNHHDCPTV